MKKSALLLILFLISFYLYSQEITRGELFNLFYKAQKAETIGDLKVAIEVYNNIISLAPQLSDPYLKLGGIYEQFENDKDANQLAILLYKKYLSLNPDTENIDHINESIRRLQYKLENNAIIEPTQVSQLAEKKEIVEVQNSVESKQNPAIVQPEEKKSPSKLTTSNVPEEKNTVFNEISFSNYNIDGRWVSDMRIDNGKEYWILDFSTAHDGLRIGINNTSAVADNSFLAPYSSSKMNYLDAFKTTVAQGQLNNNNELLFKYVIDYQYVPSTAKYDNQRRTSSWISSLLGDKYGLMELANQNTINSDQEKDIAKNTYISYDFKLKPTAAGLIGSMRLLHVEKTQSGEKVLTDKVYDCNFFRTLSTYQGFSFDKPTEKDKKDDKDYKKILKKLKSESKANVDALNDLGFLHLNGLGTKQNYKEAMKCFEKAAEKGSTIAMNNLAVMHQSGLGLKKTDANLAIKWYEKAAELNNSEAMAYLGDSYLMRNNADYEEAVKWYKKAFEAGNDYALYRIGWMLSEGIGFSVNPEKAWEYYSMAVEKGNATSMYEIGDAYKNGIGVNKSYTEAFEWYKKAAEKGNTVAMGELVSMYQTGLGTEQNYATAMSWLRKKRTSEANQRIGFSVSEIKEQ